jgi:hypothetical protein
LTSFLISRGAKSFSEPSPVNCTFFALICYLLRRLAAFGDGGDVDRLRAALSAEAAGDAADAADLEASLVSQIPSVSDSFRADLDAAHADLRDALMRVFEDRSVGLSRITAQFSSELRRREVDAARSMRAGAKFWRSMTKALSAQAGGPWSQIGAGPLHFKFDGTSDALWRRNKMRLNRHFDDHADAALLRDSGTETESKAVRRVGVSPDEVVDVPEGRALELELDCQMVSASRSFGGKLYLTAASIAFEAKEVTDTVGDAVDKAAKLIEVGTDAIAFVLKRRYLHIDCACEVFTVANRSRFFVFGNADARGEFFKKLKAVRPKRLRFIQTGDAAQTYAELKLLKRWNSGAISNYEYLYWLNLLSGRSIHDLSQYPVFPWVVADYASEKIDFCAAATYRDLGLPIGAMNAERIAQLRFLFGETFDQPFACLYRFHYSAPAYVIGYFIRKEPFTSLHIQLQNGRFDLSNRLFFSVPDLWSSVTSSQGDFRELVPEFYANPEFLLNADNFDLGFRTRTVAGEPEELQIKVDDVELPPWAPSAPAFVALNRIALESAFVSAHLHEWIDLIFGR